jgi:putative toxin-antitoxin system antitoxin component (TIGR02293 family)
MSQMKPPLAKAKQNTVTAGVLVRRKASDPVARNSVGGVVRYWVHGPSGKLAAQEFTPSKLIQKLKAGLPIGELDDLQSHLDLPMDKLAPMLGISKATLHRRKNAGRLDPAESDRVARFAQLLGRAATVMESLENGRRWLASPQVGLGGAIPLEYAETEIGAREVEDLLGRIEYGVYS